MGTKNIIRIILKFLLLLLLVSNSSVIFAAEVNFSPVQLTLTKANSVGMFVLSNPTKQSFNYQVETMMWKQVGNQDIYQGAKKLIVTPPLLNLPANGKQMIRVGYFGAIADKKQKIEQCYRVFIKQLPINIIANDHIDLQMQTKIKMLLQLRLPIFILPNIPVHKELRWSASRLNKNRVSLSLQNGGNVHIRVLKMLVNMDGAKKSIFEARIFYLLAQNKLNWVFKLPAKLKTKKLEIFIDSNWGEKKFLIPVM